MRFTAIVSPRSDADPRAVDDVFDPDWEGPFGWSEWQPEPVIDLELEPADSIVEDPAGRVTAGLP